MKKRLISLNFITTSLLIVLVISSRLLTSTYGFTPMLAAGIFGGALFMKKKWALIIPIAAIWLSDLFINNTIYAHLNEGFVFFYPGWYWQYAVYALIPLLSIVLFKDKINLSKIAGMSVASPVLFFAITNFGAWLTSGLYPITMEGLGTCFLLALPFFKGYFIGTVVYSTVLFGTYYLIEQRSILSVESKFSKKLFSNI